jgi:SNF2 family DNA or RNA helicase
LSGKLSVLACMLASVRAHTRDRVVLVSNYTKTLDVLAAYASSVGYTMLRLDGSTSLANRQALVDRFNDRTSDCCA